jgi:predicted DsbA family dithiol-disulfide isomerase
MVSGLKQTAEQLGLPFGPRTMTYNSRLAQELGLWAEDQNRGEQFHLAAFKTYFADGLNLSDKQVLLNLADSVQLPASDAAEVIETRSYADRVEAHWLESRQLGITAVPTCIMGLNRAVGAQSYQAFVEMALMAGARRKR